MPTATLTISSKNYSSWSLRGWLLMKLSGVPFEEVTVDPDDATAREEILLLSPSIRVPCLTYGDFRIWDTLAIGEFLNEIAPDARLLPADRLSRARCRSICGELHSGFNALRAALPMNLKGHFPKFKVWSKAQGDIARIEEIWRESIELHGGPYLFGDSLSMADAMYAPVVTRLRTYEVALDPLCENYCDRILAWPAMQEWITAAKLEEDEIEELEVEF
ncbi:glutathione S-transferase family protein [Methylocystis sp. MJC1]|jgi:glutathione S-transferase|uniref:glutathione S-transferase family protein n=1 Tax=Methylocystis sp. MJC1 TaxID=2654282 RepID=UPI0013EDE907|nr:glutathione S-transferase family protein [Methylocystis sp. MJC1]KAF2992654.1 Glutathione S-transferase YfcF [Methylocystis sp. MJC1]MBU6526620.1 glutathione S-transferase family protein [Methylocystis sp. MJC1]UZX13062.1 glutathione S-transferase family protein [Methylocystis sp. MJC1]